MYLKDNKQSNRNLLRASNVWSHIKVKKFIILPGALSSGARDIVGNRDADLPQLEVHDQVAGHVLESIV
jgi:hypothetical protein